MVRMLAAIVDLGEQYIFERHLPARDGEIFVGGGQDRLESDRSIDRHDLVTQLVVGRVQ